MKEPIVAVLLLLGAALGFMGALGLVRLPDLYTRMQAATKAGTLGSCLLAAGVAVHFGTAGVTARVLLIVFFILLTAPVAAQVIARAAYAVGVPLWTGTWLDERRPASGPGREGSSSPGAGSGSRSPGEAPEGGAGRTPP